MKTTPAPVSYRGLPLVTGGAASAGKTVLTVETYIKWYDVYAVAPSGAVRAVDVRLRREYEASHPDHVAWSDHVPTPGFCRWLPAQNPDWEWDGVALELVAGRWLTEGRPRPDLWHWVWGLPPAPPPACRG